MELIKFDDFMSGNYKRNDDRDHALNGIIRIMLWTGVGFFTMEFLMEFIRVFIEGTSYIDLYKLQD